MGSMDEMDRRACIRDIISFYPLLISNVSQFHISYEHEMRGKAVDQAVHVCILSRTL